MDAITVVMRGGPAGQDVLVERCWEGQKLGWDCPYEARMNEV